MKATLHIPTEQYGFVGIEDEFETSEEALIEYRRLSKLANGGVEMEKRAFNTVLDELMTTNAIAGDPGMMEGMSIEQQVIIHAIKRSRARTNQ